MLKDIGTYDWTTWQTFLQEHWIVIAIVIIVLLIVIRVVKTVLKWALVAAILAGLFLYSGYKLEDLSLDNLKAIGTQVADSVKREAMEAMTGEAKEAVYTASGDGTFTVKSDNLEITGQAGDDKVKVTYRGAPIGTWPIDDTIRAFIDQAKSKA